MQTAFVQLLLLLMFSMVSSSLSAEGETVSLEHELAGLLAGEYDSQIQMQEDRAAGVDDASMHLRVNRRFSLVNAPDVGEIVMVGTTAYHFGDWVFDQNEFMVWTLTAVDEKTVVMSPRRFKEQEKRLPFAADAGKLSGFAPDDLESAIGGAACDIVWKRQGNGFIGSSRPCSVYSTTKDQMLEWEWHFQLNQEALWISFAGRDSAGNTLDSTPSGLPYRLDRQ